MLPTRYTQAVMIGESELLKPYAVKGTDSEEVDQNVTLLDQLLTTLEQ